LVNRSVIIVTSHRVSDTLGGVEKFVESFSNWCVSKGIETIVISRSLTINPVRISHGAIKLHEPYEGKFIVKKIKLPFLLYYFGLTFFSFATFFYLLKLTKKLGFNADSIVIHSQDINFSALATVMVGKITRTPTVIHQHGPYQNLITSKLVRIIEQSINRVTCKLADTIIATDDYTAQYIQRIVGQNSNKIRVIPAGIELDSFKDLTVTPKDSADCFTIGYIGRLSPEKNLETLLIAFKEFKISTKADCKLVIVGDGELRIALKDLANKLDIVKCVEFVGFQKNVKKYLADFDVFILPSKIEGTPISLMEAMAAGKAIITSCLPSIRQIIGHKKNGLLFDPYNAEKLKDSIAILYHHPEFRMLLGKNAKEKSKQYDFSIIFSRILECGYFSVTNYPADCDISD